MLQAVILAAGRGKRLHPITARRTKAMAPVVGKPIVERVMELFFFLGIRSFIIVYSPYGQEIVDYFQHNPKINAEINLVSQPEPLGMAHALLQAKSLIQGDFILSACDNLVSIEDVKRFLKYWAEMKPDTLLTSIQAKTKDIPRMGILQLNGNRVIRIVEKPSLKEAPTNIASLPLYLFSNAILDNLQRIPLSPRGEYEIQDAIQHMIEQGRDVRAVEMTGRRDLTRPKDLLEINLDYLTKSNFTERKPLVLSGKNTQFVASFYIEESVTIGSNCQIGPNVYIEHGSTIGDNVNLRNVVILRKRKIPSNNRIEDKLIW